jgi:hypothetical protein
MHSDRISGMEVSCGRRDGLSFLGSPQVFARFRVGQRFIYMCFVFFTVVLNVASFSGFSVLDCHFGFR